MSERFSINTGRVTVVVDIDGNILSRNSSLSEAGDVADTTFTDEFNRKPGVLERAAIEFQNASFLETDKAVYEARLMDQALVVGETRDVIGFLYEHRGAQPQNATQEFRKFLQEAKRRTEILQAQEETQWQRTIREDDWSSSEVDYVGPMTSDEMNAELLDNYITDGMSRLGQTAGFGAYVYALSLAKGRFPNLSLHQSVGITTGGYVFGAAEPFIDAGESGFSTIWRYSKENDASIIFPGASGVTGPAPRKSFLQLLGEAWERAFESDSNKGAE